MPIISVTLPSDNTSANVADYNVPITTILSTLNGGLDDDNIASLSGTKVTANTLPQSALTDVAKNGWNTGMLPAISSATYNGNGNYSVVFASSISSIVSPADRFRGTRTTPANSYMGGAFNGTNHYFTKTTATSTLSTMTNNHTFIAAVELTSYKAEYICGRSDSTPNNWLGFGISAAGQLFMNVGNGGSGNTRTITALRALPLNKKIVVAGSWTSGTVVLYVNGVSVPVAAATTSGTAPTTAGTGGDFSIGRLGAYNAEYFAGYISNVAAFNAVLSAATIRQYSTYKLLGSEPNCVGAWSLDNTGVNQQAAGTNDLTATNSVGYSSRSPHGNELGTIDYGIFHSVSGVNANIQMAEGSAIPVTGSFSSIEYSHSKTPYGFPTETDKWALYSIWRSDINSGVIATAGTYVNLASFGITLPIGKWDTEYSVYLIAIHAGVTFLSVYGQLSTSSSVSTDLELSASSPIINVSLTEMDAQITRRKSLSVSAETPYYFIQAASQNNSTVYLRGTTLPAVIVARNAYL